MKKVLAFIIPIIITTIIIILLLPKRTKVITEIKSMSYSYTTSYYANKSYELTCNDKCIVKIHNPEDESDNITEITLSDKNIQRLINILNYYHVLKWHKFHKVDKRVLDGNSFDFHLRANDNITVDASGYMKYPKNYKEVRSKIENLFVEIIDEEQTIN